MRKSDHRRLHVRLEQAGLPQIDLVWARGPANQVLPEEAESVRLRRTPEQNLQGAEHLRGVRLPEPGGVRQLREEGLRATNPHQLFTEAGHGEVFRVPEVAGRLQSSGRKRHNFLADQTQEPVRARHPFHQEEDSRLHVRVREYVPGSSRSIPCSTGVDGPGDASPATIDVAVNAVADAAPDATAVDGAPDAAAAEAELPSEPAEHADAAAIDGKRLRRAWFLQRHVIMLKHDLIIDEEFRETVTVRRRPEARSAVRLVVEDLEGAREGNEGVEN